MKNDRPALLFHEPMSKIGQTDVLCPHCGGESKQYFYASVNVTIDPTLKDRVLDGSLFKKTCPKCETAFDVRHDLLYHDIRQKLCVWLKCEDEFGEIKLEVGAERADKIFEGYTLRIVFRRDELVEKIKLADDGDIAGPNGEADWIIMDPAIDFKSFFTQFDTILVGRRTFEAMAHGGSGEMPGMKTYVFSRTLRQKDYPKLTIVGEQSEETLAALREKSGKDIWLFGGGSLFRSLLDAGFVDTVEVAIIPVLLGGGIPLLLPPAKQAKLKLTGHKIYESGIVSLEYAVRRIVLECALTG